MNTRVDVRIKGHAEGDWSEIIYENRSMTLVRRLNIRASRRKADFCFWFFSFFFFSFWTAIRRAHVRHVIRPIAVNLFYSLSCYQLILSVSLCLCFFVSMFLVGFLIGVVFWATRARSTCKLALPVGRWSGRWSHLHVDFPPYSCLSCEPHPLCAGLSRPVGREGGQEEEEGEEEEK